MNKYCLIAMILIVIEVIEANQQEDYIKKLRTELFKNRGYDVMAIPIKNLSQPLNVEVGFVLTNVLDFDIKTHILSTEGWLYMSWNDQHLTWEPEDYGQITAIRISPDEVFRPDIMLFNAVEYSSMKDNMVKTNLILYSTGTLLWSPPVTLKSTCEVDLTNWPFDEQECFLRFGSWTHDGLAINITNESYGISLHNYSPFPEWEITYTNSTRKENYYDCCPEPYPDVTFFIRLKRKTTLYHYTVFLPVTTAMILNLLIFWFPLRSYLRFILSGISLLMLTIVLLNLGTKLDSGAMGLPFAIHYISLTILIIGFTLIWSTIARNLLHLRIKLPERLTRITAPANRILYASNDSVNIPLANEEDIQKRNGKSDNSLETVVLIIDKMMFAIFFITLISLHL